MKLLITFILLSFGTYLTAQNTGIRSEEDNSIKGTNSLINNESDSRSKAAYSKFNSSSNTSNHNSLFPIS